VVEKTACGALADAVLNICIQGRTTFAVSKEVRVAVFGMVSFVINFNDFLLLSFSLLSNNKNNMKHLISESFQKKKKKVCIIVLTS